MQKVEAYRVEIPIVAKDEYSKEFDKAEKAIDSITKKSDKQNKSQEALAKSGRDLAKSQREVDKSAKSAQKGVESIGRSAEASEKSVRRVSKTFESFGSKVKSLQRAKANIQVTARDGATRVLKGIKGTWEGFRRNPVVRLTVWAKDSAMGVLRNVRRAVTSIPTMVTIALSYVGVKNFKDATVGAAMNWEQYEVSMEHWLDGNIKQAKELTKWMGEFADITPFSSPELFPALVRAVSVTDKDIDKSKRLLGIASDMAALTPGRSVEDAMGALASAKMGNTVMLEAYGLDVTKKQMDDMGGWDKLVDQLEKKFLGGAEKLSKTAAGVLATLKGYRGSMMRAIGTGFLEPMKPRLDAINQWLADNQETWGRWKDVAMRHGKDVSEGLFSNLEKAFSHIRTKYLDNPEFMNLDLKGKIKFISEDVKEFMGQSVTPKITEWWDETGSGVAVEIGKLIGEGIIEGIKLGLKGGSSLFTSAWGDLFSDVKEHGLFSKQAGSSMLGAGMATLGAGYLGKKFLYNPGKAVFQGGKKAKGWVDKSPERQQKRQQKWTESNEKRTQKRLERGDKAAAKKEAKSIKKALAPLKNTSKYLKRVPMLGAGITALSLFGSTTEELPGVVGGIGGGLAGAKLGAMGGAALGSVVPGLGTAVGGVAGGIVGGIGGSIGGEKLMNWLFGPPKKASASELNTTPYELNMGGGVDISGGAGFNLDTTILQRNIDNLTTYLGEASGQVVGAFTPLEASTGIMNQTIEALNMNLAQSSGWVVESFFPLVEASGTIAHNVEALSTNLADASIGVVESFFPLNEGGALMNQNVSALSLHLGESAGWVVGAFYPLEAEGSVLTNNVSVLSGWVAQASGWINSLYGVQDGASAVKSALNNLASRIRNVPTPNLSGAGINGPKPVAYARGGVATSPHLGLVAEAGYPEAMIPWDGSDRSKALWQQTGEALGMFGDSSGGGLSAVAAGGSVFNIGDINILESNNLDVDSIMNMITPELYKLVAAAIAKRGG